MYQNIIYILLILNIINFLLGYLSCYIFNNNDISVRNISNSVFKKNKIPINHNIEIDDKKIVVDIDTKGLEKKYESLGEVSQSANDIGESINKLKNLKR